MAVLKVIAITQQLKKLTYGFLLRTKFLNPKLPSIPSCDHQVTFCTFLYQH